MITGPQQTIKTARKLRSEMTRPEVALWAALRPRPGGFKFRRQHPAGHYVLDFYCAKAKLAIEVDGRSHDGSAAACRDANRSAFLKSRDIATLRIPASIVLEDVERVVARIVEVCAERVSVPLHQTASGPPPRDGEDK